MRQITIKKVQTCVLEFFNQILQLFKSITPKQYGSLIFLFIPLIFLLNAVEIHHSMGKFFLRSVDPEYFYLYNGILIGGGNLSIQFIATPGIPVDFLIGLSSRIINLFQTGEYGKDFIDDPEKYIHAANLLMSCLTAIVLFICGIYTRKYSRSFYSGLLFQLGIFGASDLIVISGRVMPEALILIPLLLMCLMVIKTIYSEDRAEGYPADVVLFGLIAGFGIACKLTFFPVLFIPLVLLRTSLKQKIRLILFTIFFFAIFAYPVIFNFHKFSHWVTSLFVHSGHYGEGANNFIDLSAIPGNFKNLFYNDRMFFFIAIFSLLLSFLFSFKMFKNEGPIKTKIIRAIFGINLSILVSLILTLKHFAIYYFIPFYLFKYILVLLSVLLIIHIQNITRLKRYKNVTLIIFSIFILYLTYGEVKQVRYANTQYRIKSEASQAEYRKIISLVEPGRPVIMTNPYYGSPFIEFAHYNGFDESHHLRTGFTPYLKEKFPYSYQYMTWSDEFIYWGDFVDFKGILNKTRSSFYIYIGKEKADDLPVIEKRIWQVLDSNSISRKVLYSDVKTGEQLIEIVPELKTKN